MIGVWGSPDDTVALFVLRTLRRRSVPAVFLDETALSAADSAAVRVSGRRLALSDLTGLYARPGRPTPSPELEAFAEGAPVLVINRPTAGISNASKPYQAMVIREAGFGIPDTLLTTSPAAARAFVDEHGSDVIYKSISSTRSIVSRWSMAADKRIANLASCPTQLQERLPPPDIRLHVIGTRVIGCEINSDADDYRYAARFGKSLKMREMEVPEAIAARARALTTRLGLTLSGLDLRRRRDGTWCCLEVNPSPAFTFYYPVAEMIATAIVDAFNNREQP